MTLDEIQVVAPGAGVYGLVPEARYIITYDINSIQSLTMKLLVDDLGRQGVYAAAVGVDGPNAIALFRTEPEAKK